MRKKIITFVLSITILSLIFPFIPVSAGVSEILIVRDDYGVPHIFADTKEGLAFGMGYAVAQDRLWQADLYRRDAFGSMAEFFGPVYLSNDIQTRSLGYSKEELQDIFDNWIPTQPEAKLKEMSLAYVDGLNAYIDEAQYRLFVLGDPSMIPIEYFASPHLLPIEPFTVADTTAIVVMMAWRFGGTGGGELGFASRLNNLMSMYNEETAWEIFNDNYPQVDPGAPTTIPGQGSQYPKGVVQSSIPTLPDNIDDIYQEVIGNIESQTEMLDSLGLPTKFGSDAWMIRPKKSLTGNAMQVGGPQMGHSIPQIVLEVGLHGAGINAVGMAMPHAPTILIGASDFGAWTSTTGSSDLIDTYIEVLNPFNHTQYMYNGELVDMEKRTEIFYGPGGGILHTEDIYRTIHGPILYIDETYHLAYTIKAPYYKNELAAEEGWSLFQQARNINDFQEATKVVTAGHNFCWIDRRGNIGFWHSGSFPIKPITGKDGRVIDDRFPLWGTGEEEWVGVTGFDEMPKSINPAQGFLANWNNKPAPDWSYSEADWGEVHRVKRIQDLLGAKTKFSFDDMNEINKDAGYNHISAMYFLEFLTNAAKADPSIPSEVVAALEAWDHHYNDYLAPQYPNPDPTYDDPGLTIYDAWFSKIDDEVFDDDLPSGVGGSDSTLLHVFDGEDSKLPLNFDYLNGEDRDTVIVRVLKEALAELTAEYGSDVSTWLTPVMTTGFSQQGALPSPTMHAMNRGTYNHIVEMPRWKWKDISRQDPPNAFNVIPPGQSGFMNYLGQFDHAYDQLPLYETWTYKPMLFRYSAIEAVADSFMTLFY